MKMIYSPSTVARFFKFVRETAGKQNMGNRVQAIIQWCGGVAGQSYCCYFATMILDICFQGNSPIPRLGSCQDVYDLAKKNGWVTDTPSVDDLFLYVDENGHAHHIGIVTVVIKTSGKLTRNDGIAGNTSEDGKSSNGTGVFEHEVFTKVFIAYPR